MEALNQEEAEQKARIALLQHFSSKSSNQTTNALTLSLVFLTFIGSIEIVGRLLGDWHISNGPFSAPRLVFGFFCAFMVSLFLSLGIRIIYRLIFWGGLAGAVMNVEMVSAEKLRADLLEDKVRQRKFHDQLKTKDIHSIAEFSSDLNSAYLMRLSVACGKWIAASMFSGWNLRHLAAALGSRSLWLFFLLLVASFTLILGFIP